MANPIDTPQVILGLDKGGTFQDFEERRRKGDSHLSDWYADATKKGSIWLSTIENNDIISFSHKFNSDSPEDQALFVFEILDPTNTFESRFFNTFYEGAESYSEVMENYALDIVEAAAAEPGGFYKEPMAIAKAKGEARSSLGKLPFSTPMYVTFGMGNNLAGWSPAQKATLATLEYGLTDEGLKKIILRFVPNPGALRLNNSTSVERYLKSTSNTKISHSELVMFDTAPTKSELIKAAYGVRKNIGGSVTVKNPVNIVFDIFKNVIKSTTKSSVIFLLDELKKPLQTRWNNIVIASARQHIAAREDIKAVGVYNPALASELQKQALDKLLIDNNDGVVTADELEEGIAVGEGPDFGDELDKVKDKLSKWKGAREEFGAYGAGAGYHMFGVSFDEYFEKLTRINKQDLTSKSLIAKWLFGKHTIENIERIENLIKYTPLHPNWQLNRLTDDEELRAEFEFFYKTTQNVGAYSTAKTRRKGNALLEAGSYNRGKGKEYNPITVYSIMRPTYDIEKVWEQFKKARNMPGWRDPNNPFRYRKGADSPETVEEAESRLREDKGAWPESITLETKNVYVIFQTAFKNFFATLGLTTGEVSPQVPNTIAAVPGADSPGEADDPKKLIEGLMSKTLYVNITTDTAEELKQTLVKMIDGLDVGPTTHLTMHSFSELSLVKNLGISVWDGTIIPTGYPSDGSLKTKEVLFVTTFKVLGSLINGTELDTETQKLMGPLYTSVKRGFSMFNEGEPSIHASEDVPFSQLFQHPKLEELQLDTDNVVTLMSDDEELQFDDSDKLNEYLLKNNIPVFNYGFKNSNILNFNFDLKLWYAHLLNILPQIAVNGAKLPSAEDADITLSLLKFWRSKNAPKDFTDALGAFYDKYINDPGREGGDIAEVWEASFWNDPNKFSPHAPDDRERYINAMTKRFKAILKSPNNSDYLLINSENQDTAVESLMAIRRQMESRLFTAKITTLPFFSFISLGKVLGKTAFLYFMEPEVVASVGSKDKRTRSTWLSGSYLIVGYDVTMSNSRLTTSFNLMKQ